MSALQFALGVLSVASSTIFGVNLGTCRGCFEIASKRIWTDPNFVGNLWLAMPHRQQRQKRIRPETKVGANIAPSSLLTSQL